jgi:hypothetical protein
LSIGVGSGTSKSKGIGDIAVLVSRVVHSYCVLVLVVMTLSGCLINGSDDDPKNLRADAGPDIIQFIVKDEEERHTIEFDGSNSTGKIQSYLWDFDRTGPFQPDADGEQVTNTYIEPGKYSVILKVNDDQDEDFDISEVFINYRQYENSSLQDEERDEFTFPVQEPATRVYGELRYDPGGFFGNNLTLEFTDAEGNSTDREGTEKSEHEEDGQIVKRVEIKGDFVLQYVMGDWRAVVERNDSAGGTVDYSLLIEVDYDPDSAL